MPAGIVQVGQDLERRAALDERGHLGEVPAHHLGGRQDPEQGRRIDLPALPGQCVQRPEHPVERARRQDGVNAAGEQVRLSRLHPGQDAQRGKPVTALLDAGQVAGHIQRPHRVPPAGLDAGRGDRVARPVVVEVQVLGEGDRGDAQLQRPLALGHHRRTPERVVGPLRVNVVVGGQHPASMPGRLTRADGAHRAAYAGRAEWWGGGAGGIRTHTVTTLNRSPPAIGLRPRNHHVRSGAELFPDAQLSAQTMSSFLRRPALFSGARRGRWPSRCSRPWPPRRWGRSRTWT